MSVSPAYFFNSPPTRLETKTEIISVGSVLARVSTAGKALEKFV